MDLERFIGRWQRIVFIDGRFVEGFLVSDSGGYTVVQAQGEHGVPIYADRVASVEPAHTRPGFSAVESGPGKRIRSETMCLNFSTGASASIGRKAVLGRDAWKTH